jgi:hypothetical protein
VVHRRLSKSFSKISPVVVVLERPDHGKYFAWVLGHELLGIVTEDEANHLIPSVRPWHQFVGRALAFHAQQLVTNSRGICCPFWTAQRPVYLAPAGHHPSHRLPHWLIAVSI